MSELLKFWNYMKDEFDYCLEDYDINTSDFSKEALSRCSKEEICDLFQALIDVYFGETEEEYLDDPDATLYSQLRNTMITELAINEQTVDNMLAQAATEELIANYGDEMTPDEMYDIIDDISEELGLPRKTVRLAIQKLERQ